MKRSSSEALRMTLIKKEHPPNFQVQHLKWFLATLK
jgi:hypothetical protein